MLPGWRQFLLLTESCSALSCFVKLHLVTNKRYVDGVESIQDIFFLMEHEEKPPLRGSISDIWETTRKISPRFSNLWHSKIENRREAVVLLEGVHIDKVATLQVSSNYDPVLARKLGLHPSDMYFAKCISRSTF